MRKFRYLLEAAVLWLMLGLFRLLSVDRASALGGWLGRRIGPRLGLTRIARANLRDAFPDYPAKRIEAIIAGMWNNLGRILGEFPHIGDFYTSGRVEIVGAENVLQLRDDGVGGIFFSAHFGNWELLSLVLVHYGLAPVLVYRHANNPYAERLIQQIRDQAHGLEGVEYLPKSGRGLRLMVKALRERKHLAMLIDQKMKKGIPVRFFGRDAMTAPALAQLALKYDVPVVPARLDRLGGAHFRITLFPPLDFEHSGDEQRDVAAAMRRINALFEQWISERPEHWLWIHNRWTKRG